MSASIPVTGRLGGCRFKLRGEPFRFVGWSNFLDAPSTGAAPRMAVAFGREARMHKSAQRPRSAMDGPHRDGRAV